MLDSFSFYAILTYMNLKSQPHEIIKRNGITFTLLGTVHISEPSAIVVAQELRSGKYDAVAIELCEKRAEIMKTGVKPKALTWFQAIRKFGLKQSLLMNGLSHFYKTFNDKGFTPGLEFKTAMEVADARDIQCILIDQDAEITSRKATENVSVLSAFVSYLIYRVVAAIVRLIPNEDLAEQIEDLKKDPNRKGIVALNEAITVDRDKYMANELKNMTGFKNVLVVIGAAHLKGITEILKEKS
jgi:pheromone shutdown protein TraB